jgi:Tyrosine phosphatase family
MLYEMILLASMMEFATAMKVCAVLRASACSSTIVSRACGTCALRLCAESHVWHCTQVVLAAVEANEPVMFYCKAGKDRTGLLAMLILNVCRVPDSDIVADYHMCVTSSLRHERLHFMQHMHSVYAHGVLVSCQGIRCATNSH